jgi:peptidoglycan LD-endopeptidase CwlK
MAELELIDKETSKKLQLVYPDLKVRIIRVYNDFYNRHKIRLKATEGLRDFARQAELYAKGRTAPGSIVTNAPSGSSLHEFGCALDSCFNSGDPYLEQLSKRDARLAAFYWSEFGRFSKLNGLFWGGDFKSISDRPHVELTYGLTLKDIQKLFQHGGIQAVWAKFDQIRGVEIGEGWLNKISASKE